jgi:hypothetical protein
LENEILFLYSLPLVKKHLTQFLRWIFRLVKCLQNKPLPQWNIAWVLSRLESPSRESPHYFIRHSMAEHSSMSALHISHSSFNHVSVILSVHPSSETKYCLFNRPFSVQSMWNIHWKLLLLRYEACSRKILQICLRMSYTSAYVSNCCSSFRQLNKIIMIKLPPNTTLLLLITHCRRYVFNIVLLYCASHSTDAWV